MSQRNSSFKTRARTIDHLGREQIADAPTAISELWKNAYDADATEVELHILDGEETVAAIVDNGSGMSPSDFEEKWLTVGTESKIETNNTGSSERKFNRQKQGQKGIGRLSCAALGSLLLIVSKQKDHSYVVSMIDWRVFENPYIMLHDISVPVFTIDHIDELLEELKSLHRSLLSNVIIDPSDNSPRAARLKDAWKLFSDFERREQAKQEVPDDQIKTTYDEILELVEKNIFTERVLRTWGVFSGDFVEGTAMFMVGVPDDLEDQLSLDSINEADEAAASAKLKLLETLSNFTDPFLGTDEKKNDPFLTRVVVWNGQLQRILVDEVREFDINDLHQLEHLVEGTVNDEGYFTGNVKAFGKLFENVTIRPKRLYKTRVDSRFGGFDIRIGAYEGSRGNTTLTDEIFDKFEAKANLYGGLRIYRDGLRVMPYGRDSSDFFEIEKRRSFNAGRYFWSSRKTFGRIGISRLNNPNLKDKAGREGLLDNRAAMLFKEIMINILISVADLYLGRNSKVRGESLRDIHAEKAEEKAQADRKKVLRKERARIKKSITESQPQLAALLEELEGVQLSLTSSDGLSTLDEARELKNLANKYNEELKRYSLSPIPPSLGTVKDGYKEYRSLELSAKEITNRIIKTAGVALERFSTKSDADIAMSQLRTNRGYITAKVKKMAAEGRSLLNSEIERFEQTVSDCNKAYDAALSDLVTDLELEKVTPSDAIKQIDMEYEKQEIANAQLLKPYITALSSIKDAIDLEGLAISSMKETSKLQAEAKRLNSLAQLGITVEIIGHEIEGLDLTIARGVKALRKTSLDSQQLSLLESIDFAHNGLSDKWRFLSPLKLSGDHSKGTITGQNIFDYVLGFYGEMLEKRNIKLHSTERFNKLEIYDSPARIYPVFINLVNNSRYWVNQATSNSKEILLDYVNDEAILADSGPGIDLADIDSLFTLFFTKKQRGGRGVGLYLCKSNLALSGHQIRYVTNLDEKILSGANFAIKFGGLLK